MWWKCSISVRGSNMVMLRLLKARSFVCVFCIFFFKQKTAYEMRISDWSSDVCSSDLAVERIACVHRSRGDRDDADDEQEDPGSRHSSPSPRAEIGRASCRERVCQYV